MKLTRFENLRTIVEDLGAKQRQEMLIKQLHSGKLDLEPKNLVFGKDGIYFVNERGILTRVLLHMVDKSLVFSTPELKDLVRQGDFENQALIKELHKYHFVNCTTLQRANQEGWREKYKISQKRNGTFFYRFVFNYEVEAENENQMLEVCGNCLKHLNAIKGDHYTKTSFTPQLFFSEEFYQQFPAQPLKRDGLTSAQQSSPNVYQQDWADIAAKYKELIGYRCENRSCSNPDLSHPELQKYLHCHHKNTLKHDNNFSNLQALCIRCHAEEPQHSQVRKLMEYHEYLRIRN